MPWCKDADSNASISSLFQLSLLWVTLMSAPCCSVLLVFERVRRRAPITNTHLPPQLMGSDRSACRTQIFLRVSCHWEELWEGGLLSTTPKFLSLQHLLNHTAQGNASHPAWNRLCSPTPPKCLRLSALSPSASFLLISLFVGIYSQRTSLISDCYFFTLAVGIWWVQ